MMPPWPPPLNPFKLRDLSQLHKQEMTVSMAATLDLIWDIHEVTQGSRDTTLRLCSKLQCASFLSTLAAMLVKIQG